MSPPVDLIQDVRHPKTYRQLKSLYSDPGCQTYVVANLFMMSKPISTATNSPSGFYLAGEKTQKTNEQTKKHLPLMDRNKELQLQ